MSAAPELIFAEGEKVLCFHGSLVYEARCLKSSITKDNHAKYLVHYAGWNKSWDEWLPENKVLKYNEANLQMQQDLLRYQSTQSNSPKTPATRRNSRASRTCTRSAKRRKSRNSTTEKPEIKQGRRRQSKESKANANAGIIKKKAKTPTTPTTGKKPTKAKLKEKLADSDQTKEDDTIDKELQGLSKVEVNIKIPEILKIWLVDDWDIITRQHKLALLPAKLTVEQIIDNYLAYKKSNKAHNQTKESIYLDVTDGIKEYFNALLSPQLLYKCEQPQYNKMLEEYPNTPMAKIYGSIHLLRLFVKMGPIMADTSLGEKPLQHILSHIIQDFLKYMVTNRLTLFNLQDYCNATSEYHKMVQ